MSRKDRVYIGLEQTFGTLNLTPEFQLPVKAESISMEREEVKVDETLGSRAPQTAEKGVKFFKGSLEAVARPTTLPVLCEGAFGGRETTTVAAGVYSHEYNPFRTDDTEPEPISVWTVNKDCTPAVVDAFYGGHFDEIELSAEVNGYLMAKVEGVWTSLNTAQTDPAVAAVDEDGIVFKNITAQMSVNGAALGEIKISNFNVKYQNGISTDDTVLGDDNLQSLPLGNVECEVEFTVKTVDLGTHYRRALATTPDECRLVLTGIGAAINASHDETVTIDIKQFEYAEAPLDIDAGNTTREIQVKGTAVADANGDVVITTIKNGTAGTVYDAVAPLS